MIIEALAISISYIAVAGIVKIMNDDYNTCNRYIKEDNK
jgi:hypothetical protein